MYHDRGSKILHTKLSNALKYYIPTHCSSRGSSSTQCGRSPSSHVDTPSPGCHPLGSPAASTAQIAALQAVPPAALAAGAAQVAALQVVPPLAPATSAAQVAALQAVPPTAPAASAAAVVIFANTHPNISYHPSSLPQSLMDRFKGSLLRGWM